MTAVAASQTLKAVLLIEKDANGDLITWSFPALEKPLETVLKDRSGLVDSAAAPAAAAAGGAAAVASAAAAALSSAPYRFSRFGGQWLYQLSVPLDAASVRARKVTHVSVGVVTAGTAGYFPSPKYRDLCHLLLKAFTSGEPANSPLPLMQIYLSVLTTNKFTSPTLGSFDEAGYDQRRAMIAPLKFLIGQFGAESITIWTAMLLRKRVFVFHPDLAEVQSLVKIFPLLGAWHRQDPSVLRPFVTLSSPLELAELQSAGVFVAGFTDPDCVNRRELYDLFVDAKAKTLSFGGASAAGAGADSAAAPGERPPAFALTKFHRTTAEQFVAAAATEPEQAVIKAVAQATKEFLDKLQVLKAEDQKAPGQQITQEGLAAAGLPVPMQQWIFNVAVAEGMAKK